MKILVTGANGQLGNELRALAHEHPDCHMVMTDVAELDLTDAEAVMRFVTEGRFTHIVNCAAFTAVDRAESEKAMCRRVNVDAVENLARAAKATGVRVVHISTDYVFDGTAHLPYRETDPTGPVSQYGITKLEGENALKAHVPDSIIVRTAWLYSPHGHNFVKTMLKLGRERSELSVVSDQIGTPTHAADLARAIMTILKHPEWMPGVYHFTDEGVASWYDFACAIHRLAGIRDCHIKPVMTADYPTAAVRPAFSLLDKTLIKKTFNIEIPHWEVSLNKCIEQLLCQATSTQK